MSFIKKIELEYQKFTNPHKRKALSIRFPLLKDMIMSIHRIVRTLRRKVDIRYTVCSNDTILPYIVKKHKSVLMRKLGATDMQFQENKKTNLLLAAHHVTKTIIAPGKKWSFRQHIGLPTYKDGYKDGVLLYQGKVISGVGGGICQMANMLYWLALHSSLEISEHYHHSYDVFPDSGRALPFGSGATVVYNYVDLEFYNPTQYTFQFEITQDDDFLYGMLRSDNPQSFSYKIFEKNHNFIKTPSGYFRYNELYKKKIDKTTGNTIEHTLHRCIFAPVLYHLSQDQQNNCIVID